LRVNHLPINESRDNDYHIEKYLCPFCPNPSGGPGELTIAIDKTTMKIAWTECTRGYANCCSIAELHAKLPIIELH